MTTQRDQPSDEELILYYYGEAADPAALRARLDQSPAAAARYQALQRLLGAADSWPVPEPGPGFEAEQWARLQPRLAAAQTLAVAPRFAAGRAVRALRPHRWLPAAIAASLLLAVGYLAGRFTGSPRPAPQPLTAEARERILVETLAEHLERSQRLFTELDNLPAQATPELAVERATARELVGDSRLYRAAAERGGHEGIAALLADLEPILLELAHLPQQPAAEDVALLRRRIHSRGLLFKTRVASEVLGQALRPPLPSRSTV